MNKFNNIKTMGFDSKYEHQRYLELKEMERLRIIENLETQPKFILQERHQYVDEHGKVKYLREITYTPDFVYNEGRRLIAEDAKGFATEVFKIKRKLFMAKYPQYTFRISYQKDNSIKRRTKKWVKSQDT